MNTKFALAFGLVCALLTGCGNSTQAPHQVVKVQPDQVQADKVQATKNIMGEPQPLAKRGERNHASGL